MERLNGCDNATEAVRDQRVEMEKQGTISMLLSGTVCET